MSRTPLLDSLRAARKAIEDAGLAELSDITTMRLRTPEAGREFLRQLLLESGDRRLVEDAAMRCSCTYAATFITWPADA